MASQWQTLVSQKLYLAKTLLAAQERCEHQAEREASNQGAIELLLRSRQLLLAMIADFYQHRHQQPRSLQELLNLVGHDAPEVIELDTLSRQRDSWWHRLEELEAAQGKPPAKQKSVSADNIIAVAAASGPDRSSETLQDVIGSMKLFSDTVAERHNEW